MKKLLFLAIIFSIFLAASAEAVTWQVTVGADDVLRFGASGFNIAGTFDAGNIPGPGINHSEARFTNINIPRNSTIDSAYLTVIARAAGAGTNFLSKVHAELPANGDSDPIDNAAEFNAASLTAGTAWPSASLWSAGTPVDSPDISSEIQAVVNGANWNPGNAIGIFWKDNGSSSGNYRLAYSWNGSPANAPKLTITWTPPNAAPSISSVTDSPDPVNVGSPITFDVDWSDPEGDTTRLHLCKTNAISGQTCDGGNWCETAGFSATSPTSCQYTAQAGDVGMQNYYAFVCDDSDDCSTGTAGTFTVQTLPSSSVSGFAWAENIGWISFSSTNCDSDNNGSSDGSPPGCPAAGTPIPNYGVNISGNGNFFGYAWSDQIGWIDFEPVGSYPSAPNYSACLDFPPGGQACDGIGNYEVGGWARAVSYGGGWDGWLKLRGPGYAVSIDNTGANKGDFLDWGWGSDVVGWISFNRINCDTDENGFSNGGVGCPAAGTPISNYKVKSNMVFNDPPDKPTIPPGYGPDGISWDYCSVRGKSIPTFNWTYSDNEGDPMRAYEIEVDEDAAFGAPKFNNLVNLASTAYVLDLTQDDEDPDDLPVSMQDYQLDWNTQYFWQVRVQDNTGNWSDWSNSQGFKPPKHSYPWVNFSWVPLEPTQNETVEFDSTTPPTDSEDFDGDLNPPIYLWNITQGTGSFVDSTTPADQNPKIQFSTLNNKVSLQLTDSDSYSCTKEKDIVAELPLPEYKEIPPIIWLKKIFAGLFSLWKWL